MRNALLVILAAVMLFFIGCEIPNVENPGNEMMLETPQKVLSLIGKDIDYSADSFSGGKGLSEQGSNFAQQKSHASENIASMSYRELFEKILSNDISQFNGIEFGLYYPIDAVEYSLQTVKYVQSQFAGWTEDKAEEMLSSIQFKGIQVDKVSDVEASVYVNVVINGDTHFMLIRCTVNDLNVFDKIMFLYGPENEYGDGKTHEMVVYETVEYSSIKKSIKTINITDDVIGSSCVYYVGTDGVKWYQNGYADSSDSIGNLQDIRYLSPEGYGFQWTYIKDIKDDLDVFNDDGILIGYVSNGNFYICGSEIENERIDTFDYNYYAEWVVVSGYAVYDFSETSIPASFPYRDLLVSLIKQKESMSKEYDSIDFDVCVPSLDEVIALLKRWAASY